MQWLARISVRRPVFTWVLISTFVVVGIASLFDLGVDRFPKIDFPLVVVTTGLPGAAPEQVETEVTDPMEEQLSSIAGLDELTSSSYEGVSIVAARFDLDKDIAEAAQEVRDRVNRALPRLPRGIDQPRVERMDPDAAPVLQMALTSTRSSREVTDFAERVLRRRIESLAGVGGVTVLGGRKREIQVIVDPARLASYGLTARDVERALATENAEIPGGDVEQGTERVQLRVQGRVRAPDELALIAVAERDGHVVRIGDVADVHDAEEIATSSAVLNGRAVLVISIRKQSGANTVAVVDALRARVEEIRRELPASFELEVVRDESAFIRNSIHAVEEHLVLGGLLAALVVLLFLWNGRSTVIAALAIPSSIVATFALIKAMGLTLNTLTLLALTLSVGIVIDDAIVVLENIVRFIDEKSMSPRRAAVLATREIGLAVFATSLSLIAVFLPVAFMSGIVGRFMASFGLTMSFAVAVSLLVSFTLTPMLSARWLRGPIRPADDAGAGAGTNADIEIVDPVPGDRRREREELGAWARGERHLGTQVSALAHDAVRGGVYGRVERGYLRLLASAMRHRWAVGIVLVLALLSLAPLLRVVAKNFLPLEDESRFDITVRAPEGTSLAQTALIGERIARDVRRLPGVTHTVVTVGSAPGDPSGRGPNQASIYVRLVPADQRAATQDDFVQRVRRTVLPRFAAERLRTIVGPISAMGGSGGNAAPVQYVLRGPELALLEGYATRMLTQVRDIAGVGDADLSLVTGRPSYEVHVDRRRAADLGVGLSDVADAMRLLVGGVEVTTFPEGDEQYAVRVRAAAQWRDRPDRIAQLTVPTRDGGTARLGDIARIERASGPASIQHIGRERQITVYCNTVAGASEAAIVTELDRIRESLHMEPAYRATLTGRSRELGRTMRSFSIALALSLVFMYLVLAAQFESWLHPVTILFSLPLTLPFAVLSLVVLGQSLNIYSMLGVLVLFGVVKKNSILQIDHMRALRRGGLSRADAIMVGNRNRLRPILMTTLAFVAGMIPLLASSGAGSGTNRAMGSVIVGGQTLSLLLTLIATPVLYSWLDDLAHARWVSGCYQVLMAPLRWVDKRLTRSPPPPIV